MAYPPSDEPQSGGSPALRRSVGEATERIHEIIDAAERVASEIRADAEVEARGYLADRRAEADRAAEERNAALDELTRSLADTAEQFKHQAERLLADLDRAIVDARAGIYRHGARAALGDEPASVPRASEPAPLESRTEPSSRDPFSFESPASERRTRRPLGLESLSPLEPLAPVEPPAPDEPLAPVEPLASVEPLAPVEPEDSFELPPLGRDTIERDRPVASVSAYPGRGEWRDEAPAASAGPDQTSEALLRATQLAVTGKGRGEIAEVLRADFPGVDTEPLLDEILG